MLADNTKYTIYLIIQQHDYCLIIGEENKIVETSKKRFHKQYCVKLLENLKNNFLDKRNLVVY